VDAGPARPGSQLPLAELRILDLTEGDAEYCGRYLADLGALVVKVEPPGGSPGRRDRVGFALRNANKDSVLLDTGDAGERAELLRLAGNFDILLESFSPASARACGLTPSALRQAHPGLVVVSITGFGRTGPYRDFLATEPVLAAVGGVLSRSGQPGASPLLPPSGLVGQTVAAHAAWAALVAYAQRLRTGTGQHADVSAMEAVVGGFDPGFGVQGSAAAGNPDRFPRDRPEAAHQYPVFGCADGQVRICVLSRRQWRAMFEWLGEPAEFADPRYDAIPARYEAAGRLHPLIAALFASRTRADLVAEGTRRGIPVAGVLSPSEVLSADHFGATGTLIDAEIADGLRARVPSGCVRIGGVRAGLRRRAPRPGEHGDLPAGPRPPRSASGFPGSGGPGHGHGQAGSAQAGSGPLSGLRVLDLGVIVFGAELGRLFADQGADVIKIENSAFPDGLRQTRRGGGMNASFAWGHRNKRGLGLDLRSEKGRGLFCDLVQQADVVTANFKPGTLESLGLDYATLAGLNPRIVVCDSSAFGSYGPWSDRMGYGPLVRASCGVSALWRYPGQDLAGPAALCDGATVYPDHVAGHLAAAAVLAALIGRERTGRGTLVQMAQADVAVMALGPILAAASREPRPPAKAAPGQQATAPACSPATAGVFRCGGDDEWCVIDVRDEQDRGRLAQLLGTTAGELRTGDLARWTAGRRPAEVMATLQAAGVPAGAMLRWPDELTDPHLAARQAFRTLTHPLLSRPIPAGARVARFSGVADPPLRPAPMPGEHSRDVARTLLGLDDAGIGQLAASGVLQLAEASVPDEAVPADQDPVKVMIQPPAQGRVP
jgi:crotonobetainyl-CoA:carnitine CoA-transferase CaiB-like acyl-CoA transferase